MTTNYMQSVAQRNNAQNDIVLMDSNHITKAMPILDDAIVEDFLRDKKRNGLDETSQRTYQRAIRLFFAYLYDNCISHPTADDVVDFRESLKKHPKRDTNGDIVTDANGEPIIVQCKATTIQNEITIVRQFSKWLKTKGYEDFADGVKGATIGREHKRGYLTAQQVSDILSQIDTSTADGKREYALFYVTVTCGFRGIEMARANVGDIQTAGDHTVLYIQGKGRDEKAEYVSLSASAERALRAYLATRGTVTDDAPLFMSTSHNSYGQRLSVRSIDFIIKQSMTRAGYGEHSPHELRHTAVTLALKATDANGNKLYRVDEVQKFARHKNIETTMIYSHALDAENITCSFAIDDAISKATAV